MWYNKANIVDNNLLLAKVDEIIKLHGYGHRLYANYNRNNKTHIQLSNNTSDGNFLIMKTSKVMHSNNPLS